MAPSPLPAGAGAFDENLCGAQAGIVCDTGGLAGSDLGGIRGVLFRTPETGLAGGGPGDDLPLLVRQRDNDVIEGGLNIGHAFGIYPYIPLFDFFLLG